VQGELHLILVVNYVNDDRRRPDFTVAPPCNGLRRFSLPSVRIRDRGRGAASSVSDVRPRGLGGNEIRRRVEREAPGDEPFAAAESDPLIDVAPHKQTSHRLVAFADVRRLTGLDPAEALRRPDTQQLTCIDHGGQQSDFIRIPLALLLVESEGLNEFV
jgi:hypothetical protein